MTDDRRLRTRDGGQRTEDRGQTTEDRRQRTEDRRQITENIHYLIRKAQKKEVGKVRRWEKNQD
jgi:hypothetical protein